VFRIRQITSAALPVNRRELEQVQRMLRERLPGVAKEEIESLPQKLSDPLTHKLRTMLFVADDLRGHVHGFALVSHAPDVGFCFLDLLIAGREAPSGGIGGALYGRVREIARTLGVVGVFFECLPDDPAACSVRECAAANARRLRFYERFGARPIVGTGYETPVRPGDLDMPHLVFDDLGSGTPLKRSQLRRIVRAILERKYGELCPPAYVEGVLASIKDDPVAVRAPKYGASKPVAAPAGLAKAIALVVNDRHEIHHVRERGYVEAPVRIKSILSGIEPTGLFFTLPAREFAESHIRAVHDRALVDYLKRACATVPPGQSLYPYVFPIRNQTKPPEDRAYAAGYYCIDTFTPLNRNAWHAARRAVDVTLTAAEAVLGGQHLAYALVRPPGHHAERRVFGGFCYFCNAAVAAHFLSAHGRVAILDVDYHHGNGQQDIFYARKDVLTVSIHGHPRLAYPFFTGFADEKGEGDGVGFNLNLPLGEKLDGAGYRRALRKALRAIEGFCPMFLVVSLGFDTGKADPTGTWSLVAKDFGLNGRMIGALGVPTLVVQEGGYRSAQLGANAAAFFEGLVTGWREGRVRGRI